MHWTAAIPLIPAEAAGDFAHPIDPAALAREGSRKRQDHGPAFAKAFLDPESDDDWAPPRRHRAGKTRRRAKGHIFTGAREGWLGD